MITEKSTRKIESNSASAAFSIQASGKMFHMVISGLYSNKAQSITREIWSNAYDAHRMSGQADRPFDVTFPTALDPTFTCRDYGAGLSHEFMMDLYTVLGHSEKENTNEAVGKWGVGRMSPLSYTDSFTVVSIHEGKKSHYVVTTGSDGAPTITPMGSAATDEPSGLSVSFPVKSSDLSSFQKAARVVSYGFPVRPNVTNGEPLPELVYNLVGEGYSYYNDPNGEVRGPQARMGCVLYPISREKVYGHFGYQNIIIDFPIGSLEVTASREQLSYGANDPTDVSISKYCGIVTAAIQKDAQKKIDDCKTLFEAAHVAVTQLGRSAVVRLDQLTFRGFPVFEDKFDRSYTVEAVKDLHIDFGIVSRDGRKNISPNFRNSWTFGSTVAKSGKIRVFVQKAKGKKPDVRAAQRIANEVAAWETFIWVRTNDDTKDGYVNAFAAQFGDAAEVVYVKDLPDPGPAHKSASKEVKVKKWSTNSRYFQDITLSAEDFKKGGLYVETAGNKLVNYRFNPDLTHSEIYHMLSPFDERLKQLIRVPKTVLQQFKDAPQWVEANTVTDKLLKKHEKEILSDVQHFEVYTSSFYSKVNSLFKRGDLYPVQLPDDLREMLTQYPKVSARYHNLKVFIDQVKVNNVTRLSLNYCNKLVAKYAMLQWTSLYDWSSKQEKEDVLRYLRMVDKMSKMTDTATPLTTIAA